MAAMPIPAVASHAGILDAYEAASGGSAWDSKRTLREEFTTVAYGLHGKRICLEDLGNGRFVTDYTLGWTAGADGYDGAHAWDKNRSGSVTLQQGGDALPLAIDQAYRLSGRMVAR